MVMPQETTSFISEGWSRQASDQRITQNSNVLSKLTHGNTAMQAEATIFVKC